jgi:hypothetical protein
MDRAEIALNQLLAQEEWVASHGGCEAAYVARYGSTSDPVHYGNGGEAIYAADMAELARCRKAVATS